jgi:SAM-dependent methyltransferase
MPGRLSFDHVANVYDETRGLTPRVMSRLLAVLLDELQGKDVLEIGVGTGRFAVPLQKSGVRVVGIDISRRMVEVGLAKGLRSVLFADGARLPIATKSFDVTMTIHVLHLIPDWREVLLEIARVTRETYVTIIERTFRADGMKREYDRLVKEAGYTWTAPGLHERDMPDLLRPDILMPVGPFKETLRADALLAELEGRSYSSQWDVPEAIHRDAIGTLRHAWGGKEVHRSYGLDVAFWQAERLPEIAKAVPQRS